MTDKKPSWLNEFTNIDKKLETEAFSEIIPNADLKEFSGYLVVADRPQGGKKINFPLRIEEDINSELEKCNGSKNAVVNALLRFAINELKKNKKTLYS